MILLISAAGLLSCNKKSEETAQPEPPKIDSIVASDKALSDVGQCYEFVQQKDTISLSFTQNGADVNGKLRFKNYEKDSSSGPVTGVFAGDTLKLTYTFQSEGMESVRDVYLLKSGNSLVMGTGEMKEEKGKQVFLNPKALKYDKSIVLVKTACK